MRNTQCKLMAFPKCICTGDMSNNVTRAAVLTILPLPNHLGQYYRCRPQRSEMSVNLFVGSTSLSHWSSPVSAFVGTKQNMQTDSNIHQHTEGMSAYRQNFGHFQSPSAAQWVLSRKSRKEVNLHQNTLIIPE